MFVKLQREIKMKEFVKFILTIFLGLLLFGLFLTGCAKTASETATEAALSQTAALHQQIKKECPTVNFDTSINALKSTITNQLASCEAEKGMLREKNNTLLAILIGLISVIVVVKWFKIKSKVV